MSKFLVTLEFEYEVEVEANDREAATEQAYEDYLHLGVQIWADVVNVEEVNN